MKRRWCRGCTYGGCVREWYETVAAAARPGVSYQGDTAMICQWWSE